MNALVLVDIQNDFLPGGALAVPDGDQVIPVANGLIRSGRFDRIVATQDWHPAAHGSFARSHPGRAVGERVDLDGLEQILWPVHCVQKSAGADLAGALDGSSIDRVFRKGTDANVDSYSGLFDNGRRRSTGLAEYLKAEGVEEVYVLGLATDYCVKFTALDAAREGFRTRLVLDGCRGVDLEPGDVERAVDEMRAAGVAITKSTTILAADR